MNGIVVPAKYKHLTRTEQRHTDDYKPQIRRLIIEHTKDDAISQQDFMTALGTTGAYIHVKRLMGQGYITRHRLKSKRGWAFGYTWNDIPLERDAATLANGGVVTHNLNLPQLPIDDLTLERLGGQIFQWMSETDDTESRGVVRFHVWLTNKLKGVKAEREAILKGGK